MFVIVIDFERNIYIEIEVEFFYVNTCNCTPVTKFRIPFEDEYVCGLETHLRIVSFLDNLRLVFIYELCRIFSYCFYFYVVFGGISHLFFRCRLYFI